MLNKVPVEQPDEITLEIKFFNEKEKCSPKVSVGSLI